MTEKEKKVAMEKFLARGGKITVCPTIVPQELMQKWGKLKRKRFRKGKMK